LAPGKGYREEQIAHFEFGGGVNGKEGVTDRPAPLRFSERRVDFSRLQFEGKMVSEGDDGIMWVRLRGGRFAA